MKETDLSYIAGLFDGEGSIIIGKRKQSGKVRIQTSISNTDLAILEFTLSIIKIGRIFKNIDNRYNLPVHRWLTSDGHAYTFLKLMYPYLRIKKIKAQEAIKKYESETWKKIRGI